MFEFEYRSDHSYLHYGVTARGREHDDGRRSRSSPVQPIVADLRPRRFRRGQAERQILLEMPDYAQRNYHQYRGFASESDSAFMKSEEAKLLEKVAKNEKAVPLAELERKKRGAVSARRGATRNDEKY